MTNLDRFVVILCIGATPLSTVNEARKHLFAHGHRQLENTPPTSAALLQRIICVAYQAGHIWGQTLVARPVVHSPAYRELIERQ